MRRSNSRRSGFTLVELAAATAITAAGAAAMMIAMQPPTAPAGGAPAEGKKEAQPGADAPAGDVAKALAASRAKARLLKDATQIRGITQAMIVFAQGN